MATKIFSIIWSYGLLTYFTSFIFECLSNLTTLHQEKSANHAQQKSSTWSKRKIREKLYIHTVISLLLAAVLFGYNIYFATFTHLFRGVAKLPVSSGFRSLASRLSKLFLQYSRSRCPYRIVYRAESTDQFWRQTRKIRPIESNAKCRYLKRWPVKVLCGRCYIYLRHSTLLWPNTKPPTLFTCIVLYIKCIYLTYSHREGGKGGELYIQSINSITPVKTTFRAWCLYS